MGEDGCLTPIGKRVPTGHLPAGPWVTLASWLVPEPQVALMPGEVPRRIDLELRRSAVSRPAKMVVSHIEQWCTYAASASAVRLKVLQFAMSDAGQVAIVGQPLPPIEGRSFIVEDRVATSCGYALWPAVGVHVLRRLLTQNARDVALVNTDGTYEVIPAAAFVPASRMAARLSLEKHRGG